MADETSNIQFPRVVAFGASAGGLQALRPIIAGLIPNGTTAYVVANHLSPSHHSNLAELLGASSELTVTNAHDGEQLVPDHVYVCPPGHDIEILETTLALWPRDDNALISPSIDRLFRSLAEHRGAQAVGILLSGSGHDGTAGAEAITAADGIVITQNPEEAVQPSMPEAAIRAGFSDLIGSGEQITAWLNDIGNLEKSLAPPEVDTTARTFTELFDLVTEETGLDLAQYKENTLRRQTVRRYRSLGLPSLEQYLAFVRTNPKEIDLLQQSFMISVSSFFRDPPVFDGLSRALRRLIAGKSSGDSIRIWIPGCATGEEPYSIAILLAEILGDRLRKYDVRIFATDIDQDALDFARAGIYSATTLESLDSVRRQQWFTQEGSGWRVSKDIRELCVFSAHDVTAHPPFIKMDLISCRNLLIYFKPEQQIDLINTFHYGLNPEGLLLLGKSESAGFNSRLFEAIDAGHKLYRRRTGTASHTVRFARLGNPVTTNRPLLPKSNFTPQRQTLVDTTLNTIAREYGPPAVLVNASFEPLHFFGRSQRYFSLSEDSVDFSVFALCLPELRNELKALCYRLIQENLPGLEGVPLQLTVNGDPIRVRPILRRIETTPENGEFALLISFEERRNAFEPDARSCPPNEAESAEIIRLRQELADTREHLQAVIEELEASNEELQSLNEEVQSSSEELQASNEELQSSNEELTTLNDELRTKSQEAVELTTTLSNIQNSIRTSLIVVDREGRITRYNPLATRIFGLVSNDIGQFLYGVPCHLQLPRLREQVRSVIEHGDSLVERVHQGEFHFLMQIDPYRNEVGGNDGAVLTFADISELHRAEEAKTNSEIRFHQVWESTVEGLLVADKSGRIVMVNPALQTMFGYSTDELIGQPVEMLVPDSIRSQHASLRQGFMENPQNRQMARMRDIVGRNKNGSEFFIEVSLSGMVVEETPYVVATVSDITLRKQAEIALRKSEQRLRLALDSAQAGTWEWYLDTNENYWSAEVWKLYGLQPNSVTPGFETWKRVIHPKDRERVLSVVSDAASRAGEFEVEWQINAPESTQPRWVLARGRPIMGKDDKPTHYIGIVIDITGRKQAETELEQHRNHLETLVEQRTEQLSALYNQAPCGYHSLDVDGFFTSINDTELGWLGYTREEMIGKMRAMDIMSPDSHAIFRKNYPKFIECGYLTGLEFDFVRKDGSRLPVLLNARAVYDEHGRFLNSLSTIIDNTDRKQAEAAWIAAREAAEIANRAKSAFLANMSHEIRTPLNAIIGLAHIMKRGQISSEQGEQLLKIDNSAHHLLAVINDILDLSKIEADRFVLDETEFDLCANLANVESMLHERASSKQISLKIECDELHFRVHGDPTRFTQAVLNLVSNAIKFTDRGLITLRLRRQDQRNDRVMIRVEVEDSGVGIPADILPRLFSPFEQGDASISRKHGGTGLGLAITKRLAELMGGEAGASSQVGIGSTFWFTAWLGIAPNQTAHDPEKDRNESDEAILIRDYRGSRILVVEDEPTNQEVASLFLDDAGLDVSIAENGAVAVDMASQAKFALVLMDMQMPVMDGLEATRKIRALPGWKDVPIVAMTANAFAEDREHCLESGMNDFITKPFDPDRFFATLLHWLSRKPTNGNN